ncbi:MAG: DNA-deoxyinosine glycosylase [Zoogloea sp.]|nr:MAG: DNA-deoxyinosine glycosylase [Zoogloea sp.]
MLQIQGFPPVASPTAHTLILGSMPGEASLQAGRYYANPRNHFWSVMGHLLNAGPELPYEVRLQRLTAAGFALWDVLKACERQGSLDSNIVRDSIVPNNFEIFLRQHPHITRIFFNGTTAEAAFRRHVLGKLQVPGIQFVRLPSTSPANARLTLEKHLQAWQVICRTG